MWMQDTRFGECIRLILLKSVCLNNIDWLAPWAGVINYLSTVLTHFSYTAPVGAE